MFQLFLVLWGCGNNRVIAAYVNIAAHTVVADSGIVVIVVIVVVIAVVVIFIVASFVVEVYVIYDSVGHRRPNSTFHNCKDDY